MDPSDFRKVGLALGFTEAELSRFEKDQMGNTLYAIYKMLYEWRKRVRDSEAREALVVTLHRIKLVQLADSVQKGTVLLLTCMRTHTTIPTKNTTTKNTFTPIYAVSNKIEHTPTKNMKTYM